MKSFLSHLVIIIGTSDNGRKVWFHDGEILREKLCLPNADQWLRLNDSLLNSPTFVAFAVSWTDFYLLAKRNFFSSNLIFLYDTCVQLFRAKIFPFR
jgi:hypothetical protein